MNRRAFGAILMMLGGLLVLGVGLGMYFSQRETAPQLPKVGARLPGFALSDLHGRPVKLSDYTGKTVILNFWATWCPPCREEMPMLIDYYNQTQPDGPVILAVNVGESALDASAFAVDYGMPFPVLLDVNSAYFDSLMQDSLPTTILVGPDGVVRSLHVGIMSPEVFQREILARLPK